MAGAVGIAAGVRGGTLKAVDVVEEHLAAIAAREPEIHAFNLVLADQARSRAEAIDAMVAAGDDPGALAEALLAEMSQSSKAQSQEFIQEARRRFDVRARVTEMEQLLDSVTNQMGRRH